MTLGLYDPDGNEISFERYAELIEQGWEEGGPRRVALDEVNGYFRISTVWLGTDHNWGVGPPLIFETMVFAMEDLVALFKHGEEQVDTSLWMDRYSTKEEALAGHQRTVARAQEWVTNNIIEHHTRKEIECLSADGTDGPPSTSTSTSTEE